MNLFIILSMLFAHILDDFVLQQPWLAKGKQKQWWQANAPQCLYQHDYLMALTMHALSWSFLILLPIAALYGFEVGCLFAAVFFINAIIHAFVDNCKANHQRINLITDQLIHLGQIAVTALILL